MIGPQTVVAAAHCVGDDARLMRVYFFMTQLSIAGFENYDPKYTRQVTLAWKAPGYVQNSFTNPNALNPADLAVLRLRTRAPREASYFDLNRDPNIVPAGSGAYLAGYGYAAYFPASDKSEGDMKFRWIYQSVLAEDRGVSMIELDGSHGKGTCKGDSGGPVFLPLRPRGLISW